MNVQTKREREKELVSLMIRIYCRKKHGGRSLGQQCAELENYARQIIFESRSNRGGFLRNILQCSVMCAII